MFLVFFASLTQACSLPVKNFQELCAHPNLRCSQVRGGTMSTRCTSRNRWEPQEIGRAPEKRLWLKDVQRYRVAKNIYFKKENPNSMKKNCAG